MSKTQQIQKPAAASKASAKPAAKVSTSAKTTTKAAAKTTAPKTAQKPLAAPVVPAKVVFFVPRNKPTSGGLLFAWTAAVIRFVLACPKEKQNVIAADLHGKSAWRHHGLAGTKRILPTANGMQYDLGYFAVGKESNDDKRKAVPAAFVDCFYTFIASGKLPAKIPDGFTWKEC